MKKLALIPARYAATRFPGKLLKVLGNKSVIATTYLATKETGLFTDVIVATDNDAIRIEIESIGGTVFMSRQHHESGSDRIAEAIKDTEADLIINVQGDTPFVKKEPLEKLVDLFNDPEVMVGSLMHIIEDEKLIADPNRVKVCVDKKGNALFFSRSTLPYQRNKSVAVTYYEHIGIYGYRKQAIMNFIKWPISYLENIENLEQLRYLENGISIRMALTNYMGISIDTPNDLEIAQRLLKAN